jgi:hypothetical protein
MMSSGVSLITSSEQSYISSRAIIRFRGLSFYSSSLFPFYTDPADAGFGGRANGVRLCAIRVIFTMGVQLRRKAAIA